MPTDIDSLLAQAAAGGGGAGPSTGPLIPVRSPYRSPYSASGSSSANAAEHSLGTKVPHDDMLDPDAASNAIYGWGEDEQRAFAKKAWFLGGLASPDDLGGAFNLWDQAVKQATRFAAAGNPMDPQDVLEMMLDGDPDAQKARKQHKLAGQTITTQKKNPLNLTDPAEVKTFLTEAFKTKMGREPTDAEVNTLVASLHAQQTANPGMSQVQTTYDENGNVASQQQLKSTGGVNAEGFLNDAVSVDPEAAEYQAAGPMFSALLRALGPASGTLGR